MGNADDNHGSMIDRQDMHHNDNMVNDKNGQADDDGMSLVN